LLSEKLALQRQLSTVQVELENAQRTAKRALARAGGSHDQSEYDAQIDELEKKLRESKLARKEAERDLEQLRHENEAEKRAAKRNGTKHERNHENVTELEELVEDLKAQLIAEKKKKSKSKATDDSTKSSELEAQIERLKIELSNEKREKEKAEKVLQKENAAWEAQRSLLDDKLAQFRTKLRNTKDKLKETEEQLDAANSRASNTASQVSAIEPTKKSKKRPAAKMDLDSIMGTPGAEPATKRGKRGQAAIRSSAPGEKSNFSITPFLNRTIVLTETPEATVPVLPEEAVAAESEPQTVSLDFDEVETPSNTAAKKQTAKASTKKLDVKSSKPLSQASSSKHNVKSKAAKRTERRKTARAPDLEKVIEENTEMENNPTQTGAFTLTSTQYPEPTATLTFASTQAFTQTQNLDTTVKDSSNPVGASKPHLKPRKSLLAFPSFTSTASEPTEKKRISASSVVTKKRKMLGSSSIGSSFLADSTGDGLPKTVTLFDEEDEADRMMPAKPIPGRGLFAKRAMNKALGKGKLPAGANMVADNGFQFSPLKKSRRAGNVSVLG
jgi:hypothetical protein